MEKDKVYVSVCMHVTVNVCVCLCKQLSKAALLQIRPIEACQVPLVIRGR